MQTIFLCEKCTECIYMYQEMRTDFFQNFAHFAQTLLSI